MSSLGRLTAALGVAHNENTLALANINFDFSLFRVDAPQEFQALGANLSSHRRQEAETGTPHRIARKLGALFEDVFPRTPELTRAYGKRVSEIAQSQRHNPRQKGSTSPFAAHIGADGTAIWAAATSGPSAIPILLLACMLARLWSASEATSLWVEVVEIRRREIQSSCTGAEAKDFVLLQAAQQDLTRPQLADWDASARAWLQTADEARVLQQTQLMLIINNLQLPVSNNMSVYESVVESLKSALLSMESILKGMPQRIQSGAALLGLSAWHIYPDMVVYGTVTKEIRQRDKLVPTSGIITLGLQSMTGVDTGVYWSLPLAHLRYYGDPVPSSRSTGHHASRISAEQLSYVALGAIFADWIEDSSEIDFALRLLSKLSACVHRAATEAPDGIQGRQDLIGVKTFLQGSGWLKSVMATAESFDSLGERDKDLPAKLMALGLRRFKNFIVGPGSPRPAPLFGLVSPSLWPLSKKEGVEAQISSLRKFAARQGYDGKDFIIRYKHVGRQEFFRTRRADDTRVRFLFDKSEVVYEYASALPHPRTSSKRPHSGTEHHVSGHKRWIGMFWDSYKTNRASNANTSVGNISYSTSDHLTELFPGLHPSAESDEWMDEGSVQGAFRRLDVGQRESEIRASGEDCIEDFSEIFVSFYRRQRRSKLAGHVSEDINWQYRRLYRDPWKKKGDSKDVYLRDAPWGNEPHSLDFIYGDTDVAALYRARPAGSKVEMDPFVDDDIESARTEAPSVEWLKLSIKKRKSLLEEFETLLDIDALQVSLLIDYLMSNAGAWVRFPEYHLSLQALASAISVYKLMPNATIALTVASKPLHKSLWVGGSKMKDVETEEMGLWATPIEEGGQIHPYRGRGHFNDRLSLAQTFACIAMFESGTYDVDPSVLEHVFAMSSGNSLFVAAPLLSDPGEGSKDDEVLRVVGNIGRAGIAMLIPPQHPLIRKPEPDTWELVNHAPFDGKAADSFASTSLHLSFTQYTMPVNIGEHGGQDVEMFFLESLVSVHDRDKWVADLDVLRMLKSHLFTRYSPLRECKHPPGQPPLREHIAIDSWEELLDREKVPVIVRAHRNQAGRLAAAAVSVIQGYPTFIVPETICWMCATMRETKPYDDSANEQMLKSATYVQ